MKNKIDKRNIWIEQSNVSSKINEQEIAFFDRINAILKENQ